MRRKELFYALLMFLFMAGCSDDKEEPTDVEQPPKEFALANFNNSGCKSIAESRSGIYGFDEHFELNAIADGGLRVRHENVVFNCASSKFEAKAVMEGKTITVTEVDVTKSEVMANCICPYDFEYDIGPLKDGETYSMTVITTVEPLFDDPRITVDSLKTTFSFTYSPTLSKTIPVSQ